MSFALRLKYSVNEGDLIIKPANVELLGRRDAWRDDIANTTRLLCELGDIGALAVYFTGVLMQRRWPWIDINSYCGDRGMLEVNIPEQKRGEFMTLLKNNKIKKVVNGAMADMEKTFGQEWRDLESIICEQLHEFASNLEEIEITELVLIPETLRAGEVRVQLEEGEIDEITGEAVQVLRDDGEFKLDEAALERILLHPKIGDKPIVVLSIAGVFREGKSFMMNFFLRYLRRKGVIFI